MEVKLQKWGNSIRIRIPSAVLKSLNLKNNDEISLEQVDDKIIEKYKDTNYNILIVGHKDSTGMLSAYFEGFEVKTIYDDYLKLSSSNCEYKKYKVKK